MGTDSEVPALRCARWSLWVMAVAVPALWTSRLAAGFTLPKLLALSAGVAVCALALRISSRRPARAAGLDAPLGATFLALLLSAAASQDLRLSLLGRHDSWSMGIWALALYAAVFFLASSALRDNVAQTLSLLAALGAGLGLHAVAQRFNLDPYIGRAVLPLGRAVGTLGSPVDLGAALALLLPAAFWAAAKQRWALAASAAIIGGLWATGSRGAWLGAACATAAFVSLIKPAWLPRRITIAALPGAVVALAAALAATAAAAKDQARVEIWKTAWRAFLEEPLLGLGPDTFEQAFRRLRSEEFIRHMGTTTNFQAYAHNDVLQALATTGLLGAVAYLWVIAALVVQSWRGWRDTTSRPQIACAASGLIALFVNVKVNPVSLEPLTLAALLAGLLCSFSDKRVVWTRTALSAIFAFGLLSVGVSARLLAADRAYKRGDLEGALASNRCELSYMIRYVNDLGGQINAAATLSARQLLLARGEAMGQRALACHPRDVNAHYIYGTTQSYFVQLGLADRLPLACRAIDEALRLDPLFSPLLLARRALAATAKDSVKEAETASRLERLSALTGRSP